MKQEIKDKYLAINQYDKVATYIKGADKLILSSHSNPDGDTLGSVLGLYHFLQEMGISSEMICPDPAPDFLSWMPDYSKIHIYSEEPKKVEELILSADVIVHIDYNAFHRAGDKPQQLFESAKASHLMIDHHPLPQEGFAAYVTDTSACSTAQLIYELSKVMLPNTLLNKNTAECLYVGLITDTGSFSYGMVDEKPYLMAADLVKAGVDDRRIHQFVYNNNTSQRIKLLGFALSEKLVILEDEHWAYISLEQAELNRFNYQAGDIEGLVNYALSIKGIKMAVLLTERDDKIRMSFRSKDSFAVNDIARRYFDGGGHLNAAGGNSYVNMEATIQKLKSTMLEYLEELKS
jgi:phosphoesterase RecJ-like protein